MYEMLGLDHEKWPLHKEVLKEQNRVNANNCGLRKKSAFAFQY